MSRANPVITSSCYSQEPSQSSLNLQSLCSCSEHRGSGSSVHMAQAGAILGIQKCRTMFLCSRRWWASGASCPWAVPLQHEPWGRAWPCCTGEMEMLLQSAPHCSAWFQSLLCRVTLCSNVRCTQEWKLSDTAVIRQANASAWSKSLKEKQKTKSKGSYKQMALRLPHLISPTPPWMTIATVEFLKIGKP